MSLRQGDIVIAGGATVKIDSALNPNSVNPVQNRVITGALNNKQAKLTAGDNITIENNVISADTASYTAGSGITITDETIAVSDLDCGTMS